jgi:hypothetical protein
MENHRSKVLTTGVVKMVRCMNVEYGASIRTPAGLQPDDAHFYGASLRMGDTMDLASMKFELPLASHAAMSHDVVAHPVGDGFLGDAVERCI